MADTKPTTSQIRFTSSKTGEHDFDQYMEDVERGTKTLSDLMDAIFDANGEVSPTFIEFRENPSTPGDLQLRISGGSWTSVPGVSAAFNAAITDCNTSETNAAASAAAAAASETAAAASAARLTGTSSTSTAIGTGSKTFTTQSGKFFTAPMFVIITSNADPTNRYMYGEVTSYSGTSLTVDVLITKGSGTYTDWTIRVSGVQGPAGISGAVDFSTITEDSSPDGANDFTLTYDASAAANKKVRLNNIFKVIPALSAESAPATDDLLALHDTSATTTDKITLADFLKITNALTEDTAPEPNADFVLTYDNSATAAKKVKPLNIIPSTQASNKTPSSGTSTCAITDGVWHKITPSGNFTLAVSFTSGKVQSLIIECINFGAVTVTWPASAKWPNGAVPTFPSSGTAHVVAYQDASNNLFMTVIGKDIATP